MTAIILTWNAMSGKPYDVGAVSGDDCEAKTFDSVEDADKWIDENDDLVCAYTKIVDLDA